MLLLGYFLVFAGVCHAQNNEEREKVTSPVEKKGITIHPPVPIDQSKCKPCPCGLANNDLLRIVGGNETLVNEFPWMALIPPGCGGTLINSRYILTAAHCSKAISNITTVRLLEHDLHSDNETSMIERKLQMFYEHPGFNKGSTDSDIALFRMDQEVEFTEEFMPACLPPPDKTFAGETGIVMGWGKTKPGEGHTPSSLQKVEVPIMTNDECNKKGYNKDHVTDNMMCAAFEEGGKDFCDGDSGGPLLVKEQDTHFVVGVVSHSSTCSYPDYPGVYTRVNRFLPWILKHTADACLCTAMPKNK